MAELHEALQSLAPTSVDLFPSSDTGFQSYLFDALSSSQILISSVPLPAIVPPAVTPPPEPHPELSAEWKPVKISPKDNPYNISVFKLPSKDGRGAWFARRSIHTDIPFPRFQACLQREFEQSTGKDDAIRGIGKEAKLEELENTLGSASIYQLAAQFPAVAPREFIQGVVTSTAHAEDVQTDKESGGGKGKQRHFSFISRPITDHPEAGERSGYVRGQYESVEYIRELSAPPPTDSMKRAASSPNVLTVESTTDASSSGRKRGNTVNGSSPGGEDEKAPHSAVEWIMITRSDPGGSVPRWMVERGTPNGIIQDALKFLKWAKEQTFEADQEGHPVDTGVSTQQAVGKKQRATEDREQEEEEEEHPPALPQLRVSPAQAERERTREASPAPSRASASPPPHQNGLLASALSTLSGGFTSLASSALGSTSANPTPPDSPPAAATPSTTSLADEATAVDSDTASLNSFHSLASEESVKSAVPSVPTSTASSAHTTATAAAVGGTPEDRALSRFLKDKKKLEEKLAREKERQLTKERKASEKHLKEMEKRERKYRRAVEKAEERKRKDEAKRQKELDKERDRLEKSQTNSNNNNNNNHGHLHLRPGTAAVTGDTDVEAEVGKKIGGFGHVDDEELKHVIEGLTRENLTLRKRVDELEKANAEIMARVNGSLERSKTDEADSFVNGKLDEKNMAR